MHDLLTPTTGNQNFIDPVHPEIETYLLSLAEQTDHPVLLQMESYARQNGFPIVGRLVGIFLEAQARMINARRVFEFGSGYGYSAYWFARAVGEGGQVICADGNPQNQEPARQYLTNVNLWERIDFQIGFAQDIFMQTKGDFDICYNDADKGGYPDIWLMSKSRIRPGGLYIADNVLWHGRVVLAPGSFVDVKPGWTEAIREHNHLIFNDPEFDAFINPTRDGVIVARRKMA
ncbi:O-methyltransferase [Nitrosomonas mobilis]|uniref:O-methyltransferase family 3 n=1 Tax=Nitrosomonas mobilis TaxID=51642 RepID=A0A1G5SH72_9PROT|nr:O-methyltransferase [Nitrosomonas mobilis]SCZ86556.1 O-methyltransferase family 3 [Nitrosomonas mobilis]HNO75095.1 O-methyltransferase [Nitrosomonas mobilis]